MKCQPVLQHVAMHARSCGASEHSIQAASQPIRHSCVFCVPTLIKGDCTSWASRLAISVLPHPVGPIIRMFLGVICAPHRAIAQYAHMSCLYLMTL
jgi:hypothetical protein